MKTILLWNPHADRVEIVTFGSGREAFTVCHLPPDQDCELVTNRTLRPIESYDAVVVNAPVIQWDEPGTETLPLLFSSRKGHQRIVFFSQESPVHTWGTRVDPNKFEGYFNWTMTYRFDSDIPLSYGRKRAFKPMLEMRQKKKYFMFNNLIKFNPKIFSMLNLLNLYSFVVFDQFQD